MDALIDLSTDELLERIRRADAEPGVALDMLAELRAAISHLREELERDRSADGRLPRAPASIDARVILARHDADFIDNAYWTVLGRPADPAARVEWLRQLHDGSATKESVLVALIVSTEGRQAGARTRVQGWRSRLPFVAADRIPGVRFVVRWLRAVLSLGRHERGLGELQDSLEARLALESEHRLTLMRKCTAMAGAALTAADGLQDRAERLQAQVGRLQKASREERARAERLEDWRTTQERAQEALELAVADLDTARRWLAWCLDPADEPPRGDPAQLTPELQLAVRRRLAARCADMDRLMVAFIDRFRGEPAHVLRTVQDHLEEVRAACAGHDGTAVLDLGCGRGEWLGLLKDAGISARGVDSNPELVAGIRDSGLAADVADSLEELQRCAPGSLRVVTAFHVAEHWSLEYQIAVLRAAHRALCAGGLLILHVPDVRNVLVSLTGFWTDPTHVRPLTEELLTFLLASAGFPEVQARRAMPFPVECRLPEAGPAENLLNRMLYGEQDLILVAKR